VVTGHALPSAGLAYQLGDSMYIQLDGTPFQ
jgi:hypothetical protein